jgi:hypothetical protein
MTNAIQHSISCHLDSRRSLQPMRSLQRCHIYPIQQLQELFSTLQLYHALTCHLLPVLCVGTSASGMRIIGNLQNTSCDTLEVQPVEFDRLVSRFEYKSSRLEYWQLGSDSYCGPLTEVDHR